jgi:hypothetical protein
MSKRRMQSYRVAKDEQEKDAEVQSNEMVLCCDNRKIKVHYSQNKIRDVVMYGHNVKK